MAGHSASFCHSTERIPGTRGRRQRDGTLRQYTCLVLEPDSDEDQKKEGHACQCGLSLKFEPPATEMTLSSILEHWPISC